MPHLKLFIIVLINAGGEGKTTIAQLIRTLFQLNACQHLGLDADCGNLALMDSAGRDLLTKAVGWSVGANKAPEIVQAAKGRPVVMDTGPNMLASQREIVELLPALSSCFAAEGYRTVALLPISPNKTAAAGALARLAPKLVDYEKFVVKNNRDGSGEFGKVTDIYPQIALDNLNSGLNAYLTRSERTIIDAIMHPDPGYTKASAYFAEWVRAFARDPNVQNLLGIQLCETAIMRFPTSPRPNCFTLNTYDAVNDAMLEHAEHCTYISSFIDHHGWSAAGLRLAADELERRPFVS